MRLSEAHDVWFGNVWYGMVWYGNVWYGMVWCGMVWYGMVWYGMVWYGATKLMPTPTVGYAVHVRRCRENCTRMMHGSIPFDVHVAFTMCTSTVFVGPATT